MNGCIKSRVLRCPDGAQTVPGMSTRATWQSFTESDLKIHPVRTFVPWTSGIPGEPDSIGINGWLAKVIRDLDPGGENVLKGVSLGQGLPRALTMKGVPVTSVNHLPSYGVLSSNPGIASEQDRIQLLESFARMYAPAIGAGTDHGTIWDRRDGMR